MVPTRVGLLRAEISVVWNEGHLRGSHLLPSRFRSPDEPSLAHPPSLTLHSMTPNGDEVWPRTGSNIFPGHFVQVQSDLFPASSLALLSGRTLNYSFKFRFKFQALPPFP